MFQFATLYSVGFARGYKVCLPTEQDLTKVFEMEGVQVSDRDTTQNLTQYQERVFEFDPSVFLVPDETDLYGYFQSGRYFNHVQDHLRKIFSFKKETVEVARERLSSMDGSPICSLHIRRGDYLSLSSYHKNLNSDYYNSAISVVLQNIPNARILAFSDDPKWCKENLPEQIAVDDSSQEVSLCMMSMCPIHVIANSSFSWWGAWLSGSKAVISPNQWFGEKGPKTWETIYEPGWVRL